MKIVNRKKAQQLVEFLLVAPLLIIILGILTEYAYALNINMTLTKALKTVTASIYGDIKPSMTKSDILASVNGELNKYLSSNNVPLKAENKLNVDYMISGSSAIFMASYTYVPAFTLPLYFFKFMPDEFTFFATAAVPSALIGQNNYSAGVSSSKLDNIWSSTESFSSQDSFNASKQGIMKDADTIARNSIIFLYPTTIIGFTNTYALIGWDGLPKKNGANNYIFNLSDGKFYTCTSNTSASCSLYSKTFYNYMIDNSFYNLFVISPSEVSGIPLAMASSSWVIPAGSSDISDKSVQGLLKNFLSITNNNLSLGNYDKIDVSKYNFGVSSSNSYTITTLGSFVIISAQDVSKIISGAIPKSVTYDFNN